MALGRQFWIGDQYATAVFRRRPWIILAGLAALFVVGGLVAFGRGLDNVFVSDDWVFLDQAFRAAGPADVLQTALFSGSHFVRPIQVLLTWWLFQAFGLAPVPYHLASLLLHMANLALLYALVRRLALLARVPKSWVLWLAVGSGLLFFLNWHHHEAIYWFSSINEPLSASLRLLTLVAAVAWLRHAPFQIGLYALSLGSMGFALLAKESAAALPLELLLLALFVRRTGGTTLTLGKSLLALVPFWFILFTWFAWYLSAPGVTTGLAIQRSGLRVMQAAPLDWVLRSLQYFDAHFWGGTLVGRSIPFLTFELTALAVLVVVAVLRQQFLWLFALLWTIFAALPNVAVVPQEVGKLHLPILAVGVFGDRYLYYSAAGAGLTLMASLFWIGQEAQAVLRHSWIKWGWSAATALLVLLLSLNLTRLLVDEADWDAAGRLGAAIVQQSMQGMSGKSGILCLAGLPDSYRGKYVFRNGIGGAMDLADPQARYTVKLLTDAATPDTTCTFLVDGGRVVQTISAR